MAQVKKKREQRGLSNGTAQLKIEKGIPIPPPEEQRPWKSRAGLIDYNAMKPGDSIEIPPEKYKQIVHAFKRMEKERNWQFVIGREGERIWRTK